MLNPQCPGLSIFVFPLQSLARERADLGRSGRSFLGAAALRSARDLRDSVPLGGLATLAGSAPLA